MLFALMLLAATDEPAATPVPVVAPPPVIVSMPSAPPAPPPPPTRALTQSGENLVSLFSTDDYPAEAIRNEEQGTVGVRLMVTTEGVVGRCDVIASSGSLVLDRATCDILQRRARFKPARDEQGRPVVDFYTQRVRWELPRDPRPFANTTERLTLRFGDDGKIASCRFDLNEQGGEVPDCSQGERLASFFITGNEEKARGMSLAIERKFEANPTAAISARRSGKFDVPLVRGVIEFDIDSIGQIANCRQLVREGDQTPADMCAKEAHREFESASAGKAKGRRGRISVTAWLEPLIQSKVIDPKPDPR